MPLTYNDVYTFLSAKTLSTDVVRFDHGPETNALRQKQKTPQALVVLAVGNGAGMTTERLFDQVFINVSIWGKQGSYESAEALALAVDKALLSVESPAMVGSTRVLYITRSGGRPQLVEFDASDRYHFTCTYIAEASTGM